MTFFPSGRRVGAGLQALGPAIKGAWSGMFGQDPNAPSYESLQRRREIADLMMARTMSQPVNNWGDGVGQVMQALGARFMDKRVGKQETEERNKVSDSLQQVIAAMGGGGGYSGGPTVSSRSLPMTHPPAGLGAEQAAAPLGRSGATGAEGGMQAGAPLGRSGATGAEGGMQAMEFRLPPGGGGGGFKELFPQVEQQFRLPNGYLERLAQIESGGDPNAANPNSSAKGLFQFIDSTARQYGVDPMDPVSSTQGAGRLAADNAAHLQQALGRAPTPGELYLAHQQGAGGAAKLLANPDAPAAQIVGEEAVRLNGGDVTMSSRDFAGKWVGKFEGGGGGYSGGGGYGGGALPDYGMISQLTDLMSNPYMSEGQRAVAQAIIGRQLDDRDGGMTEYQRRSLELDERRFEQGAREGPKFYGNVQWAERPNPQTGEMEMVPYQIGTDGSVSYPELGDGARPLPQTRSTDLGTSIVAVGPGGAPVGPALQKDVAGEAAQTQVGKRGGEAAAWLGSAEIAVQAAVDQADRIVQSKALPGVTGMWQGRLPAMTQKGADLVAQIDGLSSKAFMTAIESLRGLGAMSEMEAKTATDSIANLTRTQGHKAFADELGRMTKMLQDKLEVARSMAAGVGAAPADPPTFPGAPPIGTIVEGHRYMGGDPNQMSSWEKANG